VIVAAATLTACGSSAVTKRSYLARANAICASSLRQFRALAPASGAGLHTLAPYLNQVLPIIQAEGRQLSALRRPSGSGSDAALLDRFLAAQRREVSGYAALQHAAARADAQGVASAEAALRASPAPFLALSYGLRSCGTPASTAA
jgi:hypothetical protein